MRPLTIQQPAKLLFGAGLLSSITEEATRAGYRTIFLVTIREVLKMLTPLLEGLEKAGIVVKIDTSLRSEPTFSDYHRLIEEARGVDPDVILGIGGGSVLDVAKLLAAQLLNTQTLEEITGINLLRERKIPLICVPTTAGTGSEVSPNSILLDEAENLKKGIISPHLVPDLCLVDPELTVSVPPAVTAATGIDAFTHCLEAFVNRNAHPLVDGYATAGMGLIFGSLEQAFRNGSDLEARSKLALGSMYGGMCLGPVNTTAIHALSYPLGSVYHIPHGLSNALLLPHVMEFNLPVATDRFAEVYRLSGGKEEGPPEKLARLAIESIRDLMDSCQVPSRLSEIKIPEDALPAMAKAAMKVQRLLVNNPREVSEKDALEIYTNAY